MSKDRIIAIGLLTANDVQRLGSHLQYVWPVEDAPQFDELIAAIDEADRALQTKKTRPEAKRPG